jgi:hypothetical protein
MYALCNMQTRWNEIELLHNVAAFLFLTKYRVFLESREHSKKAKRQIKPDKTGLAYRIFSKLITKQVLVGENGP